MLLSWEEELALQRLLDQLTETLETPVKLSNTLRSWLILQRHVQSQIVDHASRQGTMVRPANNDQTGIAMFEQRLAAIFQAGPLPPQQYAQPSRSTPKDSRQRHRSSRCCSRE